MNGAHDRIATEVTSWPGVTTGTGRFGAVAFHVGRREIGHLHGDSAAHFTFPKAVAEDLRRAGRVGPHPIFPDRVALAARAIAGEDDVRDVIALMRLNYDRAAEGATEDDAAGAR